LNCKGNSDYKLPAEAGFVSDKAPKMAALWERD